MELAAKIGTMARRGAPLPYDAEVEWISTDGNQFLDTLIPVTNGLECDVDISLNERTTQGYIAGIGVTSERYYIRSSPDAGRVGNLSVSLGGWWSDVGLNLFHERHIIKVRNTDGVNHVTFGVDDGVLYSAGQKAVAYSGSYTFNVFRMQAGLDSGGIKLHEVRIFKNGIDLFRGKPVRIGQIGYVFDDVSGKLIGASGTGAFIVGPDVVSAEGGY